MIWNYYFYDIIIFMYIVRKLTYQERWKCLRALNKIVDCSLHFLSSTDRHVRVHIGGKKFLPVDDNFSWCYLFV